MGKQMTNNMKEMALLAYRRAMEWKIGEIREVNGEWYQCVAAIDGCRECSFRTLDCCTCHSECMSFLRSDGKSVIFKKLEKVGKPYEYFIQGMGIIMVQEYILANADYIWEYSQDVVVMDCQNGKVAIETKQTKNDIEEKKIQLSQEDYDYIRKKLRIIILPGNLADDVDSDELTGEIMKLFTPSKDKK